MMTAAAQDDGISLTQIVVLVLSSSVLAGIVSACTQLGVAAKTRGHTTTEREAQQNFNRTERTEKEQHERLLRREAAHDSARAAFLPMAQAVHRWLQREQLSLHWQEDGSFRPPMGTAPVLSSVGEAVDKLSAIATGHPTRATRDAARALLDDVKSRLGDTDAGAWESVSVEDWGKWVDQCREVIEAIHTPDATPAAVV